MDVKDGAGLFTKAVASIGNAMQGAIVECERKGCDEPVVRAAAVEAPSGFTCRTERAPLVQVLQKQGGRRVYFCSAACCTVWRRAEARVLIYMVCCFPPLAVLAALAGWFGWGP